MNIRYRSEDLYTQPYEDTDEVLLRNKWKSKKKAGYVLKTINCGQTIEAEIYPIWDTSVKRQIEEKTQRTSEEEREIYERRQRKYVRRLVNVNFGNEDSWATFTFLDKNLPKNIDEARNKVRNYLRRLFYAYEKKYGNKENVKYIYAIELIDSEGCPVRCNIHLIINISDRDMIEKTWKGGGRTQARRLQPDDFGLTGMAMYVIKASQRGQKAYGYSMNLNKPKITKSENKVSNAKARRMAIDRTYAEEILKKLYPKFRLLEVSVYHNEIIDGFYITARFANSNSEFKNKNMRMRQ